MGLVRAAAHLGACAAPRGLPVARRLVGALMGDVFGELPVDEERAPGDPGLHGPGTATWRVLGDPAAIIGGVRGLVVQLLHPLAMAGVADHSAFGDDPLGRLRRTSGYVAVTAFGALDDVLAAVEGVRRRHVPVRGHAPDGRAYRAADPHLLAWVSVALTESFLATDAAYATRPVGRRAADRFVLEQSRLAALLDERVDLAAIADDPHARAALRRGELALPMIEEGALPTSVRELDEQLDRFAPELALTHQGRRALGFLRRPPLDGPASVAYPTVFAGALATVPRERRERCGLPVDGLRDRAARASTFAMLQGLRVSVGRAGSVRVATRRARRRPVPATSPGYGASDGAGAGARVGA